MTAFTESTPNKLPTTELTDAGKLPDLHDRIMEAYVGKFGKEFARSTRERIHWICSRANGLRILDVGCSQGITSILLGRERRSVIGIDIARRPIDEARNYIASEPDHVQSSVRFVHGDFIGTDIGSGKFDTVIMGEVLEHLTKPGEFITAAAERLNENGTLILTVPFGVNDWPDHKQTFYFFEPWNLLSAHFNIREVKFFGKWIGFVCRKNKPSDDADALHLNELFSEAERAFQNIERDLLVRSDALTSEVNRLSSALQSANDQSTVLSTKLYEAEVAQKLTQERVGELAAESELYTARICEIVNNIATLEGNLQTAHAEKSTSDSKILRLEAEHAAIISLTERFKREAEDYAQKFDREQRDRIVAENKVLLADSRLEATEILLKEVRQRLIGQTNEIDTVTSRLRQLRAERDDQDVAIARLGKELGLAQSNDQEAKTELEYLRQMLDDERSQRRNLLNKIDELQDEISDKGQNIERLVSSLVDAEHLLLRTRSECEQYKIAFDASHKEVADNKELLQRAHETLEVALAQERGTRLRNEELQRKLQQSSARALALRSKIETAEKERVFSESRVLRTRNMTSFQLGYALIQASKSWRGLAALPGRLREISSEAKHRAKGELKLVSAPAVSVLELATPPSIVFAHKGFLVSELKSLKIACIMDEFTYASFEDEAVLAQLTPAQWQQELEAFQPVILFVESAWRGKDELWGNQVGHRSNQLTGVVEWCRERKIPTVFWNKEDPIHYETFLNTAALFDHVFTTDIDCIGRYKAALGHGNVWFLPFACPSNRFNPIETYHRQDSVSFAGAYYARYPDRNRDLADFITAMSEKYGIAIYDRNYGKGDPRYQFPVDFQPFIVGHLPYEQIEEAYKGYTHAINMNSIKQSQSMFARRVYELLGCNTITVSNFSRGVRNLFGDLVICSDNGAEIMRRLDKISDETAARKFRLLGQRKVMSEHTTQDRIAYIATKALGKSPPSLLPHILVVAYAKNKEQFDLILSNYQRQSYEQKRLCLILTGFVAPERSGNNSIHIVQEANLQGCSFVSVAQNATFIAGMVAEDYYGCNYLTDLALATRYFAGQAIGKCDHYGLTANGEVTLTDSGQQYQMSQQVMARAAIIALSVIGHESVLEWTRGIGETFVDIGQALFIDEFNYCENGSAADSTALKQVDDADWYIGTSMREIIARAEAIRPDAMPIGSDSVIQSADLAKIFKITPNHSLTFGIDEHGWQVASTLPDGKHEYIYAAKELQPCELGFSGTAKLHLETTPGLNIQFVLIYLDQQKQRLGHEIIYANQNAICTLAEGTALVRIGLRLYGPGTSVIKRLFKGHKSTTPGTLLGKTQHLVLTNHYPQYDDLYRNVFVHSRVKHYYNRGVPVDVFRFQQKAALSYHEFEDMDVITGGPEALEKLLCVHEFKSIAVHFLDPAMWLVLEQHIDRVRINVWIHGAEIQPWHRRDFNFKNDTERQAEKTRSDQRLEFWRELFKQKHKNLHVIFVSKHFSEEVMEDLGFRLTPDQYSIIYNPIDTDLFAYQPKQPFHRQRILSIRTYASKKYANDLSVAAILALNDRPFFSELEFRLIGDGELFDEVTAPLKEFGNVVLEKRFVSHGEIVPLQAEYGVFLTPTRWDSHGVSRDEAMSSGLVAITNRVSAIPEFLDETCGYLVEEEDAAGLAAAIAELYEKPDKFQSLSKAAAERVRRQCDAKKIIRQELALITGEEEGARS